MLSFLPFAAVLDPLPQAVLGAIVIAAVLGIVNFRRLVGLYRKSPTAAALGWSTWAATLVLAPNVHWGVVIGLAATVGGQLLRPVRVAPVQPDPGASGSDPTMRADEQRILVDGLLWLGSHGRFERRMTEIVADHPGRRIVVDLGPSSVSDPRLEDLVARLDAQARGGGGSVVLGADSAAMS